MNKLYLLSLVSQVSHFLAGVLAGAVMFLGLALVTVGLDMASVALASKVADSYISQGLMWTGRVLFTVDVGLLVWWLVYSFIKSVKHRR